MRFFPIAILTLLAAGIWAFGDAKQIRNAALETPAPDDGAAALPAHHRVVTPWLSVGSQPDEQQLRSLYRSGIRTVVSVDGCLPPVKAAARYKLRYVHIPIGYDGISAVQAATLARVVRECEHPIYVHCHHGRHRGPAAACIMAISHDDMTPDAGTQLLRTAGTSPRYAGLWRAVARYHPTDLVGEPLVPQADVDPLVGAMVDLDQAFEALVEGNELLSFRNDQLSEQLPLLDEAVRESSRFAGDHPQAAGMRRGFQAMQAIVKRLGLQAKKQRPRNGLGVLLDELRQQCQNCHQRFRD